MIKILKKYKHEFVLGILICIYIAYFTTASFLRYDNFYTGRFDLGNMDQTVWNTINGRIFQTSNDSGVIISRLSAHADFILILISPFYLLWSNPKTLLLIQTVVLALGTIFVFLIAKEILKNKNFALIFGFLFLMNPPMQYTNLYDFHAVTLATTLLLASFYFLIKQKYFLLTIFLILSGITKEQVWVITSVFGFPLLFQKIKKVKFLGIGIIVFSLGLFYYLVSIAIPQSLRGQHFALAFYSDFGNSPAQIIKNVLLSPQKTIAIFLEASRLEYIKQLFMPLGFISIFSPALLIFAVPDLLLSLLSSNLQFHQIYYQYSATITPFIFISSIFAVKNITKLFLKIPKLYIGFYLLIFTILSSYFFGPLPGSKNPNLDMFTKPYSNKGIVENFLSTIPEKYSVAATNNLGAHLSHKQSVATIPMGIDHADIILFLLNDRYAQPSLDAQIKTANNMKLDKNYIKVFEKDEFVVFKKLGVLL